MPPLTPHPNVRPWSPHTPQPPNISPHIYPPDTMPVHHVLKRCRAPICRHRPHQNAPTTNRGPHVFHPMAPDLTDYLGRRKVPRCSLRYFRSPPPLPSQPSADSSTAYPPPHQPGVITPAPPQFPNCYPPTSHTPYPTHPPTTEPHNMDRDSCYLG